MTYALIGDSQGVGVQDELGRLLHVVFSDPKSGWTTGRIRREGPFERALASSASTIVLVTGGNDNPLDVTALRDMVALVERARKRLVVVGPVFALTDDAGRHDRARAQLKAAVSGTSARWVDAYPLTRDLASPANVHLTAARYRIYAGRLASAVGNTGWATLAFAFAAAFGLAYAATRSRG